MKILQANKFFFINGGSETVMFQERNFLLKNGHQVIDFSMQDDRNLVSDNQIHFVNNRSYKDSKSSRLAKVIDAFSFIHSPEAVKNISCLIEETKPDIVHCRPRTPGALDRPSSADPSAPLHRCRCRQDHSRRR